MPESAGQQSGFEMVSPAYIGFIVPSTNLLIKAIESQEDIEGMPEGENLTALLTALQVVNRFKSGSLEEGENVFGVLDGTVETGNFRITRELRDILSIEFNIGSDIRDVKVGVTKSSIDIYTPSGQSENQYAGFSFRRQWKPNGQSTWKFVYTEINHVSSFLISEQP